MFSFSWFSASAFKFWLKIHLREYVAKSSCLKTVSLKSHFMVEVYCAFHESQMKANSVVFPFWYVTTVESLCHWSLSVGLSVSEVHDVSGVLHSTAFRYGRNYGYINFCFCYCYAFHVSNICPHLTGNTLSSTLTCKTVDNFRNKNSCFLGCWTV
jgi:hypothetical protein